MNTITLPTCEVSKYLAALLTPYLRQTDYYVKNCVLESVHTLESVTLAPGNLLVSLDMVSLFTRIPLESNLQFLESLSPKPICFAVNLLLV